MSGLFCLELELNVILCVVASKQWFSRETESNHQCSSSFVFASVYQDCWDSYGPYVAFVLKFAHLRSTGPPTCPFVQGSLPVLPNVVTLEAT